MSISPIRGEMSWPSNSSPNIVSSENTVTPYSNNQKEYTHIPLGLFSYEQSSIPAPLKKCIVCSTIVAKKYIGKNADTTQCSKCYEKKRWAKKTKEEKEQIARKRKYRETQTYKSLSSPSNSVNNSLLFSFDNSRYTERKKQSKIPSGENSVKSSLSPSNSINEFLLYFKNDNSTEIANQAKIFSDEDSVKSSTSNLSSFYLKTLPPLEYSSDTFTTHPTSETSPPKQTFGMQKTLSELTCNDLDIFKD